MRPAVAARRVAAPGLGRDDFTYTVVAACVATEPAAPGAGEQGEERRGTLRRRTRLRSGKVVGPDGLFVVECLIANRSAQGGLLRLPSVLALPPRILLYEDQTGELAAATVVWRRGRDLGIRFSPADRGERHRAIADSMRRKFYAVRG